jgi:endo-1,4-beta-D-glucanase Y
MKAPLGSFSPFLQWIAQRGYLPVTVDLVREQVSLTDAPAGFYAVMGRCAAVLEEKKLSRKLFKSAARKIRNEPQDYYSYTLYLLSQPEVSP